MKTTNIEKTVSKLHSKTKSKKDIKKISELLTRLVKKST